MKANTFVYPFVPFVNLADKNIHNNLISKKGIDLSELKRLIEILPMPNPQINGETIAEKILSIFQDENYRFGPREYIQENKDFWVSKLNYFINHGLLIQLTILGFPFKVPVPLKTSRTFPDMGEVLSLLRLSEIADNIQKVYPPGAVITIFTEGVFGRFSGVPEEDWIAYREFLEKLNELLGLNSVLKIIDLSEMEKIVPDFQGHYQKRVAEFKELYQKQDPDFLAKYRGTYESVLRIVSTKMYDESLLMDVYNENLKDEEITAEARKVREDIKKRTHESIFQYHAYLKTRDDIDYLEKVVPHGLPLTVSPKANRLGIFPVSRICTRLPYHGVPVYSPRKNLFLIEYLIDIKRRQENYTQVYFDQDQDNKPFYYIALDNKI
ncbi:MAG: L-tyrosine/L-tryptophan isonitrile synthase family protein [bacterium]|nr:L-tyrosine/L-tryptophan isonitrile synthase family protein [bacterium]